MDKVAQEIGRNAARVNILRTGITALIALGILESIQEQGLVGDLLKMEHNSPEYLHTLVEALRLAFAGDSPSLCRMVPITTL
jgi:hypothetical protein